MLVFGPDAGLVRERAEAVVRASVDDIADPFSVAARRRRCPAADASGREARRRFRCSAAVAPSGCGPAGVVSWLRSRRAAAVASPDCRVVIRGRRSSATATPRSCERAKNAAALPCYADGEDLARLHRRRDARRHPRSRRTRAPRWYRCSAATAWRRAVKSTSSRSTRAEKTASSSTT